MAASGVSDAAEDCSGPSAVAFRAALASALSFSRQHCLYLRPEPQWQGSLRPGRAIVVAVIERVYCTVVSLGEGFDATAPPASCRQAPRETQDERPRLRSSSFLVTLCEPRLGCGVCRERELALAFPG